MSGLCITGGISGFVRRGSIPSMVAGVGYAECPRLNPDFAYNFVRVGLLYLWSADTIRRGATGGLEGALGESFILRLLAMSDNEYGSIVASALLLISSLPRVTKGPVPMILSVTSATTALYYGSIFRD